MVEVERAVEFTHHRGGLGVVSPDDDAVGPLEVGDRRALTQEFGVRGNRDGDPGPLVADDALDLVAGADRHRGFGDHDGGPSHRAGDVAGGLVDVGEVGEAVAAARGRADRDEHRIGAGHRLRQVGGEGQALLAHVLGDERVEAGLVDRDAAVLESSDLLGCSVDARDGVAEIRKASPRDQADVACPYHCNPHDLIFPI